MDRQNRKICNSYVYRTFFACTIPMLYILTSIFAGLFSRIPDSIDRVLRTATDNLVVKQTYLLYGSNIVRHFWPSRIGRVQLDKNTDSYRKANKKRHFIIFFGSMDIY